LQEHVTAIFRVKEYAKQEIGSKQLLPASTGFLSGLLFNPADGDDMFL
jgi:hypothetical protein